MNKGRTPGSLNNLNKLAKEDLLKYLSEPQNNMKKLISHIPMEDRFQQLKSIIKILIRGSDHVSICLKELIFEQLKGEFNRYRFYFASLPNDKKASELRQFLKMLPPDKIEIVLAGLPRG